VTKTAPVVSRPTIDVRALPGSREVVVTRSGGLFPVLARSRDGQVLAMLRGGTGHLGLLGRIDLLRSRDAGLTWSAPAVVVDSDWDDSNKAFGRAADGRLVLAYLSNGRYAPNGDYEGFAPEHDPGWRTRLSVTTSANDGWDWSTPRPIDVPEVRGGSPFGKVVVGRDGRTLMSVYVSVNQPNEGIRSRSWLIASGDGGTTWEDPRPLHDGMNETALTVLVDGDILAVMRSETGAALYATRSSDGGTTWSAPQQLTQPGQHPGDLVALADGSLLLAYGNRNAPYRIEGLVSRDGGRTWLDRTLHLSGPLYGVDGTRQRTDLGYPSSVVVTDADGKRRGVTVYYYNPTMPAVDDVWRRRDNPLFEPAEYMAVAISWLEEELLAALPA
jgi:hypothetical protein